MTPFFDNNSIIGPTVANTIIRQLCRRFSPFRQREELADVLVADANISTVPFDCAAVAVGNLFNFPQSRRYYFPRQGVERFWIQSDHVFHV